MASYTHVRCLGARVCIRYIPNIVLVRYIAWCMQVAQPELAGAFPKTCSFLACPTVNVLRDVAEDFAHSRFAQTECS